MKVSMVRCSRLVIFSSRKSFLFQHASASRLRNANDVFWSLSKKNYISSSIWHKSFIQMVKYSFFSQRLFYQSFYGASLTLSFFFSKNTCSLFQHFAGIHTYAVYAYSKYRKLFLALWQAVKPLKITMTCKTRKNNTLAHTYQWGIRVYTVYAYVRICIRARAYMHTRIRVLGWRALRVYFGSDISELHCRQQLFFTS